MYELVGPISFKDLSIFQIPTCFKMIEEYIIESRQRGVDIGSLPINSYIYNSEDPIFLVEYTKLICNLVKVFNDLYNEQLYKLKLNGIINNGITINFNNIFKEINHVFNCIMEDQFIFDEFGIYHSEISLEFSILLYEKFNEILIQLLKPFVVDHKLLKIIFSKEKFKYVHYIYDDIFNQLEKIFLSFY